MTLGSGGKRRVLLVSAHFPPDTTAASHRLRLLAPHLPAYGWEPTVVTVDPVPGEGTIEPGLVELLPGDLRVVRVPPWSRRPVPGLPLRIGDVGIRALVALGKACARELDSRGGEVVYLTIPSHYIAILGPWLRSRYGVAFVLDYVDPWVSAWGLEVGGGPGGAVDWKSRVSRGVALALEPSVAARADGFTAVSKGTFDAVVERNPSLRDAPFLELPYGGEPGDFARARERPRPCPWLDPPGDAVQLCYVGTLLPLGQETLRALLAALARLKTEAPDRYQRLRLHFLGTSNQVDGSPAPRVLPVAEELGVLDRCTEVPLRIPYLDALAVLTRADGIIMLGSSEAHYTASKLYPALLARRPLLAIYHRESSVTSILERHTRPPTVSLVTYDDRSRAATRVDAIARHLADLAGGPAYRGEDVDLSGLERFDAHHLAGTLAEFLTGVVGRRAARGELR